MDTISDLPDCILLHILSFLPTKTSFLTTLLSRRWTHLCDNLQHLHFDQNQFRNGNTWSDFSAKKRFLDIVNWIISRHKAPPIRTFRLTCDLNQSDEFTLEWFIRKVLGPNLEELNLQLSSICWSDPKVAIPNGVFSCTSLVTLRLNGGHVRIPSPSAPSCRYHLPSLKTLQLYNVKISDGNLEEILSHCTALETLVLDLVCRSGEEGQLSICFPSLKSLHFKSYFGETLRLLVIDTPSLKRLDIQVVSGFHEIRVRNLHNVEEANINIAKQSFVLGFLVELCRIRILELGLLTIDCLPEVPPHRIPEFTCLQRLELTVWCLDTRYIMNMLQKCPMLKLLALVFIIVVPMMDPHPSPKWEHPVKVPTCLASHLQVIKIKGYFESRVDREFFAYVLQHGLVLESLDIQVDRWRAKGLFPVEISLLPRSSKACQINFCWI
ncbi:FBD-associated F-box protein At4g10400-like [Arachis stenosperma]|uniref:FBD-associated F-box protein At4g10400-like n=1 Tax=Arachis stenosperma TaxID=217475 RepID=UPI0025AD27D2|nr:FBD-associated F-box protein At4g10400-like [Arachis stenosperma]